MKKITTTLFFGAMLATGSLLAQSSKVPFTLQNESGSVQASLRGQQILDNINGNELVAMLHLSASNSFFLTADKLDDLGIRHQYFQQYYNGYKVDGAMIMLHSKAGFIQSINGKIETIHTLSEKIKLDDQEALAIAQEAAGVKQLIRNYAPEFVVVKAQNEQHYALCYLLRLDGYTISKQVLMKTVAVDVTTGKVLQVLDLIAHGDVNGTAHTMLYGTKSLTLDDTGNGYRLMDNQRGIRTLDAGAYVANNTSDPIGIFPMAKDYWNNTPNWTAQKAITKFEVQNIGSTHQDTLNVNFNKYSAVKIGRKVGLGSLDVSWPTFDWTRQSNFITPSYYQFVEPGIQYQMNIGLVDVNVMFNSDSFFIPFSNYYRFNLNTNNIGVFSWNEGSGNAGKYTIDTIRNPALDVHWGMGMTFDYFQNIFNRNSYDGQGGNMINYVNGVFPYVLSQNNAAAISSPYNIMVYGLGDDNYNPFVAIDIVGHEFTHLLISNNGNGGLRYRGESGALNESFADIFGTNIEFYADAAIANWKIGEMIYSQSQGMIRSMAMPKLRNHPNTYKGEFWKATDSLYDNGGVHFNSGVQNYWYYLLSEGGSGINDNGDSYNVNGITRQQAEKIAYRNMMYYLHNTAQYRDAYFGSLEATMDLYGEDTTAVEYETVKAAWYAVGIGPNTPSLLKDKSLIASKIQIYPNPVRQNKVNIHSEWSTSINLGLYDVKGKLLKQWKLQIGDNTFDISGLAKGNYFIKSNEGDLNFSQKLVVID